MIRLLSSLLLASAAAPVLAAEAGIVADSDGAKTQIGQLIADGYEIKAAVPNGKRFVVFLQKDSTAYACEMSSLTQSQCGQIN
ncbi:MULTISPECIES: hypothetical protein [unclassified Rhizobium]|uniref:hypothetical protein n=1 Tax=unclassified Rhizobium TaxID=2613769 RepID=UPI001603BEB5|nr:MULTISPECIES: hypothetical protein [unclassified Rhizobium]MBB1247645.1 hypothetical protein [Rhizobium sp. G21]MCV3764082.1 hypothetical protein [Rhizobium sp. TRM95796]